MSATPKNTTDSKAISPHELAGYWLLRFRKEEQAHCAETLRRASYQDALNEIYKIAEKNSPIRRIAQSALGLPK